MHLGNLDGRAVLVRVAECLDVHAASDGRFGPDPMRVLADWAAFRAWASEAAGAWHELDEKRLGPPVPAPRQVFAVAVNYRDHAAEANIELPEHPLAFTKFPSCITGPFSPVLLPTERADWEVELVVVVGQETYGVDVADAWDVVAGLTVGQDISERRIQFRKPFPHFSVAKSLPTFGPIGPVLVTPDGLANRDDLEITCHINGELMQRSRTSNLVFSVPQLIAELSSAVRLLPGDLIFTGTPSGVGSSRDPRRYLKPGDIIESRVEDIGAMRNVCEPGR
ncbi:MAG TPA: fumarylacetoacetate hydrolase family protein [Candidatus Dormibacteraeota bacterium]